jgi:hypothetical protein
VMTYDTTAMSDEEADNSQRSLPKSTPVPVLGQRGIAMGEINISANQVLVALAAGFCLMGPLVWAFVRYWLFAL